MDSNIPEIRGNTYGVEIQIKDRPFVKINGNIVYEDKKDVMLFWTAYRMGRDHKKNEIRHALGLQTNDYTAKVT